MDFQPPKGPFCQSCAMPLEKAEDAGTNADGYGSQEYCRLCFQGGAFTDPIISMEQMIARVSGIMVARLGMLEGQAGQIARTFVPRLKRWRTE